jgi:hypothetical protein
MSIFHGGTDLSRRFSEGAADSYRREHWRLRYRVPNGTCRSVGTGYPALKRWAIFTSCLAFKSVSWGISAVSVVRVIQNFCYSHIVTDQHHHIDKPEPRWQALLAFLAVGAIYLALPRNLVFGPIWLLPTLIVVLLIPTVVSHRIGKRSLNRALGLIINGITTIALIGSVVLLVRALPSHRESPLALLRSGGLLWLTNVIVFALWYWRLDGGGPTLRHERKEFGSTSFLFPQMQIPHDERAQFACAHWRPRFVDYFFVSFTQSSTFGPTDAPLLARWAKIFAMIQISISLSIVILLISRAVGVL